MELYFWEWNFKGGSKLAARVFFWQRMLCAGKDSEHYRGAARGVWDRSRPTIWGHTDNLFTAWAAGRLRDRSSRCEVLGEGYCSLAGRGHQDCGGALLQQGSWILVRVLSHCLINYTALFWMIARWWVFGWTYGGSLVALYQEVTLAKWGSVLGTGFGRIKGILEYTACSD